MALCGVRNGVSQGSACDLRTGISRAAGSECYLREARSSEPSLAAASQIGLAGTSAAAMSGRTRVQTGGSENLAPQAYETAHRQCQRRRAGTHSAKQGLRNAGASMVVGKVHSTGALASPRVSTGDSSVPQRRASLGDITNGQGNWEQMKATSVSIGEAAFKAEETLAAIFAADAHDPQKAGEYTSDIFAKLLEKESLCPPKADYMQNQADINGKMRAILIDWLVEVHMKYHLRPETLFLTVSIIDRYLSSKPVARKKLQLLGVVAMLIAAKYEEIDPPRVQEFAYITDNSYTKKEIVNMEATVLVVLNFQIAVPTPAHFLERLQRVNGCDGKHRALAEYALELSLLDLRSLQYPPSMLVGASILLSNAILGRPHSHKLAWDGAMAYCTRHSEASLCACAEELRGYMESAKTATLQAVWRKYKLDKRFAVATLSLPGAGVFCPQRVVSAFV